MSKIKENQPLIEETLGRKLSDSESNLIEELSSKINFDVSEETEEPKISEENEMIKEIQKQEDCIIEHERPKKDNPFNNISKTVYKSKALGKQVLCKYAYISVERDGELVGYEGGITSKEIQDIGTKIIDEPLTIKGEMDAIKNRHNIK